MLIKLACCLSCQANRATLCTMLPSENFQANKKVQRKFWKFGDVEHKNKVWNEMRNESSGKEVK